MDDDLVKVNLICNELEVPQGEALYYLEGFQWNLDSAMKACRNKTSPPPKTKSWPQVSFNNNPAPVVSPMAPIRLNSRRISSQNQPKELAPETKKERIDRFREVAYGLSLQEVVECLELFNWNVERAVDHHMKLLDSQKMSVDDDDGDRSAIDLSYLRQFPDARIPAIGVTKLDGFSKDETSAALAMDLMDRRAPPLPLLPSQSQFHAAVGYPKQMSSSSGLNDLNVPAAIPLMASSKLKIQESSSPAQNREEELLPPIKIDRICEKLGVSQEEANYYLEGFNWNLSSAMEACRVKTLPPVKVKSSPGVSVNVKSAEPELESPSTPVVINSRRISTQMPELVNLELESPWTPVVINSRRISTQMPELVSSRPNLNQMPEALPSQEKEALIRGFLEVASGVSVEVAIAYLDHCKWSVPHAVGRFMEVDDQSKWPRFSEDVHSTSEQSSSFGSSSSSMDIDQTKTEELLKEGNDQTVSVAIPPVASSQVDKKMSAKAVEEDSSTETITIEIPDGTAIKIPFRPDQTVRDIRNAIEARRPDIRRDYYFSSQDVAEYMDLDTTVHRICTGEFRVLFVMYP